MRPSQVAEVLRRIASNIEASKQPNRRLVAKDLQSLLTRLGMHTNLKLEPTMSPEIIGLTVLDFLEDYVVHPIETLLEDKEMSEDVSSTLKDLVISQVKNLQKALANLNK